MGMRADIAAFDTRHRSKAAKEQSPLSRAARRPCTDISHVVYLEGAELFLHDVKSGTSQKLSIASLRQVDIVQGVAFADASAYSALLKRLIAMAGARRGDWLHPSHVWLRQFRLVRSLTRSYRMPLLTETMAYLYWLPVGVDESLLDFWRVDSGGNLTSGANPGMDRSMLVAQVAVHINSLDVSGNSAELIRAESRLIDSAAFGGIKSSCGIFQGLTRHKDMAEFDYATDPLLVRRAALDGLAHRIDKVRPRSGLVVGRVGDSFKLKPATKVRALFEVNHTIRHGSTEIRAVTLHGDSLDVSFPPARNMDLKTALPEEIFLVQEPFTAFGPSPKTARWMDPPGAEAPPRIPRDVPFDVLVAGAPKIQGSGTGS